MAIKGNYRKLYGRFKFIVRIQDFAAFGFQTFSAIKMSLGVMTYREGGALAAYKEPALVEFDDVTLTRGHGLDQDMWQWILDVVDIMGKLPGGIGLPSPDYMRNLTVDQLDRDDSVGMQWHLYWAFPRDYESSEWDNNAEEVAIETMVLAYHHPDREDLK
jgi:phage tail-like protein